MRMGASVLRKRIELVFRPVLKSDHIPAAALQRFLIWTTPFGEARGTTIDTRGPHSGVDDWAAGWVWGLAMKYALESVTVATFAVFLAWSFKILMAWV